MNKKIVTISAISLVAVIAIASTLTMSSNEPLPDPEKQDKKKIVEYVASKSFSSLPLNRKKEYFDKLEASNIKPYINIEENDPETIKNFKKNSRPILRAKMKDRVTQYSSATPQEKIEILDNVIDMFKDRKALGAERRKRPDKDDAKKTADGDRAAKRAKRMTNHYESTSPVERAEQTQFKMDLIDRMQERGESFSRKH